MKYVSTLLCGAVAAAGITVAVIAQDHGQHDKSTTPPSSGAAKTDQPAAHVGDPYPFDTCPITGKKLGTMGDPVVKVYDGREVRFCCPACPPKFEKDLAASLAKLDEQIIKDQSPIYPLTTSVVSDKALGEHPVQFVYGNRLIRVADESEKAVFMKDGKKHLETLDTAVIAAQSKNYTITKCPVSGEEFGGDMGKPVDIVIAGRMVRLCCNGCKKAVNEDPVKFIAMADAAMKAKPGSETHTEGNDHSKHDHN